VRSIGADHVIDFTQEDFTRNGQRYDRILDLVARHSMFDCKRALRPKGVYVLQGASTGRLLQGAVLGPLISMSGSARLQVMWWWKPFREEDVMFLNEMIDAGSLLPVIDRRYPLGEVAEAMRYMEQGNARGKIVIAV
jgi:NADPH:quinone reductase-like Zn-dependent oxidoreductase